MTATATPATRTGDRRSPSAASLEIVAHERRPAEPPLRRRESSTAEASAARRSSRRLHELARRVARSSTPARAARCESLARTLRGHDLAADHYHAGLEPAERARAAGGLHRGPDPDGVVATTAFGMGIDKPDVRLVCALQLSRSRSRATCRWSGAPAGTAAPRDTLLLASRADAQQLRRFARRRHSDGRRPPLASTRGCARPRRGVAGGARRRARSARARRDARAGGHRAPRLRRRPRDADRGARPAGRRRRRGSTRSSRATSGRRCARADRLVRFAESARCRHRQVAEHFGETLVERLRHVRRLRAARGAAPTSRRAVAPLPDDVAGAIHRAALDLRWPLGRTGLVSDAPRLDERAALGAALARTSACSPRPARPTSSAGSSCSRSPGALESCRERGRLPRPPGGARRGAAANRLAGRLPGPADEGSFERLRAWRLERARARRGARLRRPARRDAPRARDREAGFRAAISRPSRASARPSSSATRDDVARRDRSCCSRARG